MTSTSLPVLAGIVSTAIFACSTLPMLTKALRTRDLASYSLGNLVLANAGNAVYSVYVLSLPVGPIWLLHAFNQLSTAFMLVWFLRFARPTEGSDEAELSSLDHDCAPSR
ncbi:hypothetical protein [Aeromicrobium ginsengisoli]|uniref:PQ-loop repeat-containing protein n=1 Tax=Aeromicrobium ginsengisoli TaxID=363867 RepID=A0A5M4FHJ2_9ACTN|nr:hypothetical protein [Aeromicrobium ginsengisoli]KAA1399597.1 hypothetical protein ESP70_002195 [Aeromicrobium ginsengisoli]